MFEQLKWTRNEQDFIYTGDISLFKISMMVFEMWPMSSRYGINKFNEKLMTGGMTKQQMKVLLEPLEYVVIKGKNMR